MNKEEAIKILQHYLEMEEFNNAGDFLIAIDIVLNLIEKQDKIIDKMAEFIMTKDFDEDICVNNIINPQLCNEQLSNCKECIKEYFKKVVEKGEQS